MCFNTTCDPPKMIFNKNNFHKSQNHLHTGHVQRRQVVDCDVIHGRLVVEQDPRGVHVIALGGHVQRCEAVLERRRQIVYFVL